MKYTSANPPMKCFMRQSTWYKGAGKTTVRGVLWHSTGANNPKLSRYVQPDDNAADRTKMLEILGMNKYGNDWNHVQENAGVHAWIGKLASGEVTSIQVGDWDKKAWGCGSGKKGSCNNGWIQFEICEDSLNDPTYFGKAYWEAVELTAYLCKLYNFDPQGTVTYNGVRVPVILCHQDSYRLGVGSNHGDVLYWFKKHGKGMQDVRNDVAALLAGTSINNGEDDDMITQEKFNEMYKAAKEAERKELRDNDAGTWSAEARQWAIDNGLIAGNGTAQDGQPNMMWEDTMTREQLVTVLFRFAQLMGKA